MPHLALLIGIGDGAGFQLLHRCERLVHSRLQLLQVGGVHMHPADVEPDAQIIVIPAEIAEPLPLNMSVGSVEIRKAHAGRTVQSCRTYPESDGMPTGKDTTASFMSSSADPISIPHG